MSKDHFNKSRTLKPKGFGGGRATSDLRERYGIEPDPFHATMELDAEEREAELARELYDPKTITHNVKTQP